MNVIAIPVRSTAPFYQQPLTKVTLTASFQERARSGAALETLRLIKGLRAPNEVIATRQKEMAVKVLSGRVHSSTANYNGDVLYFP